MFDIRKALIVVVIGILFAIFTHTVILAVHESPDYGNFCKFDGKPRPLTQLERVPDLKCPDINTEIEKCTDQDGRPRYDYDEQGCPVFNECSLCDKQFQESRAQYEWIYFLISSIMAIAAIIVGLYIPKNNIGEMVSSGFMLGGLIALFVGTGMYFGEMNRILKPFVMAIEIGIVIFVAWTKFGKK